MTNTLVRYVFCANESPHIRQSTVGVWVRYDAARAELEQLRTNAQQAVSILAAVEFDGQAREAIDAVTQLLERAPNAADEWGGVEKLAEQRNAALAEVERLRAALNNAAYALFQAYNKACAVLDADAAEPSERCPHCWKDRGPSEWCQNSFHQPSETPAGTDTSLRSVADSG